MSARADLCGGRSEMIVPTATSLTSSEGNHRQYGSFAEPNRNVRIADNTSVSRSMSPMRGDVKKILLPPLREETDVVVACIQPNLSSGEVVGSPRIPDKTK
jgi:hypothetical protein